jgi:glycosyltransferase involved in cell wall biosynthesis
VRPLRIAYIGQRGVPATIGGVEHHVEEIGWRLAARGHAVTVYTRSNYTSERVAEYRGMRVRYVPTAASKHLEALVASGLSTLAAMSPGKGGADIIHYHAIGPSIFSPVPRMLTRRRVVMTVHGLDYERDKWGGGARAAIRTAGWMSAHVPHATITVARNLAELYRQQYRTEAHYIPNGVGDPVVRRPHIISERWGLKGGDYLLFLGRLVPEKAPDLLVSAFKDLDTDTRLVIAGGSSFTDDYVRRLEELAGADPRVIMAGPVYGEVRDELYSNAAAFVNPSKVEGLPITLLEAASYRLPLVASDIPAHVEVIGHDGPGGHLFRKGDKEALSATLARVLSALVSERHAAGTIGDRIVGEYNWDAVADATEALYERILTSPARALHNRLGRLS